MLALWKYRANIIFNVERLKVFPPKDQEQSKKGHSCLFYSMLLLEAYSQCNKVKKRNKSHIDRKEGSEVKLPSFVDNRITVRRKSQGIYKNVSELLTEFISNAKRHRIS